jgi:hypothetical protein
LAILNCDRFCHVVCCKFFLVFIEGQDPPCMGVAI